MPLFSGQRRRMLAPQGHDLCFIGLDITAVIGLSPLGGGAPGRPLALWLVRQTMPVVAGPDVRYHRVLCLARSPGGLDIEGFSRLVRTYHVGLDITLTISILEVWGPGVC